jgi:amyloid beta precursor protein binding protein 1
LIEQNHVIFNFSFFIESDSIGLSRAQVATQNLLELNPDVRGDYIDESVDHIMAHSQDFFDTFSVVIATSLPEKYDLLQVPLK